MFLISSRVMSKERQTRNYHPLKFVNAACRTNINKYSCFPNLVPRVPGPLKNGTNFPKRLLKLPTQRPSSLPWWLRPGPIEHLNIFYITSTTSLHCFLAHTTRAQHTSAEYGLHCPLLIRHLDWITLEDKSRFTCITGFTDHVPFWALSRVKR